MCELLGSEPIESEIPVEFDDLHTEVQEAYIIYNVLQDNWDTMSGSYLGKYYTGLQDIFNIYEVEDSKTCLRIIQLMDIERSNIVNKKKESPAS